MADCPTLNYIDIFAGCGGLSLGLYNAGWKGLFAIEKNSMAFATLKHNLIDKRDHFEWPEWLLKEPHDIKTILEENRAELAALENKVDLVAGGPPCQGFSFAGKRDEQDHRNQLVNSYIDFVSLVKPKMIFFENVRGFTSKFIKKQSEGIIYSKIVAKKLDSLGFNVKPDIIDFSEYGIPQKRRRFILIGIRKGEGDVDTFFEKLSRNKKLFLTKRGLSSTVSSSEAISDLEMRHGVIPSPDSKNFKAGRYGPAHTRYQEFMKGDCKNSPDSHRFVNHKNKTIEKFKSLMTYPRNKNLPSGDKKSLNINKNCITPLDPNQPSPTLTTLPDDYIHYSEPRVMTVREFARLQSFNDWFEFREKYTTGGKFRVSEVPRYSQVGNAIPPLFVEQAGTVLKAMG
jgi:DNA (cytosine-5)-methyltransferase 1